MRGDDTDMTDIYRVLSDATRRTILSLLLKNDLNQTQLLQHFSISQPAINKHLRILKEEGLIKESRQGRYCLYSVDRGAFERAYAVMRQEIERMLDSKLASLKGYLENEGES